MERNDEDEVQEMMDVENANPMNKEILVEFVYFMALLMMICIVISIDIYYDPNIYHTMAYFVATLQCIVLVSTFRVLLNIPHYHIVIIERKAFNSFCPVMLIPTNVVQNRNVSVKSWSSLYSTHGSSHHEEVFFGTSIIVGILLTAIVLKIDENEYDSLHSIYENYPSLILYFICVVGIAMPVKFELDTTNPRNLAYILHYTGALIVFYVFPFAFMLQQQYSLLSIILLTTGWFFCTLWIVVGLLILPDSHSTKAHQISLFCIFSEGIAIAASQFCGIAFLFCLDDSYN